MSALQGYLYSAVGIVNGRVTYRIQIAASDIKRAKDLAHEFPPSDVRDMVNWTVRPVVTKGAAHGVIYDAGAEAS